MSFALDFLKLRRPVLNYISPPICEIIFSSTGVVIELSPFTTRRVTGLVLGGTGGGNLVWDTFSDAVCYNVYKESAVPGIYDLVLECVPGPDVPFPDPPGCYRVSALTPDGETDLSDPFCISDVLPVVLTLPASDILCDSVIFNGVVNPMGFPASVFFQWGETLAYGNSTAAFPAGSGAVNTPFDDLLEGLDENTIYHYRAAVTNGAVLIVGLDAEFTTPSCGGDPTGPAPCSLFEVDDTSFGVQALTGAPTTWSSLPIGSYQWVFVDHVFQRTDDSCPLGCEAAFFMLAMGWTNTLGASGSFPTQNTASFPCCGGGFSSGYISEAAAVTNYHTQTMPGFFLGGANGATENAAIDSYSTGVAGSPVPTFDLVRVLKLSVAQPQTLQITNLAGIVSSCPSDPVDVTSPAWGGATVERDLNLAQWREAPLGGEPPGALSINGVRFGQFTVALVSGADAPVAAATASVNSGGAVDAGAHSWKVVFSTTFGGQSGGGPASNVLILGASSEVGLTNIPIGPAGITQRHIYRTLAGGSEYHFVATINNNVDTTFTDNVDDATLFNGGFITLIKPASCFWACNIEVLGGFDVPAVMWAGVKLIGQTPEGVYQVSQPYIGNGPFLCPYSTSGLLPNITITGTF